MQKIENVVITTRQLGGEYQNYHLGEGVEIDLSLAPEPLVAFLIKEYDNDPRVLKGHIQAFLEMKSLYQDEEI